MIGAPPPFTILCAGRLYCDVVMAGLSDAPKLGAEVYSDHLTLAAGGGAYITAAYLAALGHNTSLAAVLPAEPFAGAIAAELTGSGIDLGLCDYAPPGAEPQITVALITGGDRAYVTRRFGAALPAALLSAIATRRYQHLHIGELATLIETPGLVDAAKSAGMTISTDCAWDAAVLARADLVQVLRGIDIFLPNREEATALERHATLADHAPLVVVKDGAKGAAALQGGQVTTRTALPVEVVDTVGAGDAFNAGFLDAWLAGAKVGDCLTAGAQTASVALSRSGGAGKLPRLSRAQNSHSPAAE